MLTKSDFTQTLKLTVMLKKNRVHKTYYFHVLKNGTIRKSKYGECSKVIDSTSCFLTRLFAEKQLNS